MVSKLFNCLWRWFMMMGFESVSFTYQNRKKDCFESVPFTYQNKKKKKCPTGFLFGVGLELLFNSISTTIQNRKGNYWRLPNKKKEKKFTVNFSLHAWANFVIMAVHFWAPTFKWGISIANIADFSKPPEKISYPQQIGLSHLWVIQSISITVCSRLYL